MQLSELRSHLKMHGPTYMKEITGFNKSQVFGYVDHKEHVSFCGIEYNIEMKSRPNVDTVAPALIFDEFSERNDMVTTFRECARYVERKEMCVDIHKAIRSAGYTLVSCIWHAHAEGDMVRCEYYKAASDGWTGTELRVVYAPTDYMPEGAIVINDKHGRELDGLYYTAGYEEGQLTYVACAEFDGRPNRSIAISAIEGQVYNGEPMEDGWLKQVEGLGMARITSMTKSESHEGWKREYTGNLLKSKGGHAVQVVVKNYHWNSQ